MLNKRRNVLLIIFLLIAQISLAQKFSIKGQLTDSASSSLPSATVMILQAKDSSLVNFGVSNVNGFFEIRNITRGDYFLKVTFLGFAPFTRRILFPQLGAEVNLGQIKLKTQSEYLREVVVLGDKPPVVVKRDTIEFNAGSFKTKVNATAEDLIKKLPGMEVQNDGTILAQGEQVQRVMVDGKEFFGQDPKLATRNLPADAVDKVQVYDKKSDQTVFSGIDDGQREKTINLELKEEKRHAAFGNDMAGVGTDGRFSAKGSLNRFDKGNQFSLLGMGNNINEQGFSIGDYANFSGTSTGGGGGGGTTGSTSGAQINTGRQNGIVTNYAAGGNTNLSYNNNKTKINGSYFYNYLDQDLITLLHRVNYLPTGNYNFDQNSTQTTINNNHRVNITVDHKVDSVNSVKLNTNLTYNIQTQDIGSQGKTWNVGNTALQNENDQTNTNTGNSITLTNSLLLRHRFKKKGRTISSNITFNFTDNQSTGGLQSTNQYYTSNPGQQEVQQVNSQSTISPTYGINFSYTEPLGGRKYLEANYNFTTDINRVGKDVYDVKNEVKTYNDSLSNKYNSNYLYSRPGVNFRMNRDKYNLTVGTAFQQTSLKGEIILKDQSINRLFQAVLPVTHFNYDFNNYKRLRFDYTTSMQEPTIQQLQPVINNSDQLNQTIGNPLLKPAYSQSIRSNFTVFNPSSFMNFFALINGNYTTNAIVSSQTTTPQFVRITKPVNVKYGASISGNFNVGIPVKVINSRFNIGPNIQASNSINLVNAVENTMHQQTYGGTARYNYSLKEILIVDLSANLSHQGTQYSFSTSQNQVYFNKTYSGEINVNFLKNYAFNTEMDYFIYNSTTTNFHQTIPLWNMSLSRFVLKNKTGEFKIGVNNLLNRSLSVTQTASTNYLQQSTTNNLGRFYMVSFTYVLNKQLNPMNGVGGRPGRGGGMRMMIRQ
jgi:Outer membrane protein beta-barrel family/Carboxypeptidase regulatory-like domain